MSARRDPSVKCGTFLWRQLARSSGKRELWQVGNRVHPSARVVGHGLTMLRSGPTQRISTAPSAPALPGVPGGRRSVSEVREQRSRKCVRPLLSARLTARRAELARVGGIHGFLRSRGASALPSFDLMVARTEVAPGSQASSPPPPRRHREERGSIPARDEHRPKQEERDAHESSAGTQESSAAR